MSKFVIDTNILLHNVNVLNELLDDNEVKNEVIICSSVLEEIDGLKNNEKLGYLARESSRQIEKYQDKITFIIKDIYMNFPSDWENGKRDNKIVLTALENGAILLSNDLNVRLKAKALGVESRGFDKGDNNYKGHRSIKLNTQEINQLYNDLNNNKNTYNFLTNEYVEIINIDLKENDQNYSSELRFDGENLVALKLPPSKIIKGWNMQQRFALDLLNNKDIPIKIINGTYGSGKSILAVKMGVYHLDKGNYSSLTFWRTPVPADDIDIGFLPGTKAEKIENYMKPLLQYVEKDNNQFYLDNLLREDKINMDVVSFLKGINIEDSYVIFDECEDLNVKLLKLVGTRISSGSCIVFTGDNKQAEKRFKQNNGINLFIEKSKGNPLVGIVILDEDVRSEASKLFADLI
jgi:PhoH-like ATPase